MTGERELIRIWKSTLQWRTGVNDDNAKQRRDSLDAAHDAYERMQKVQKAANENMSTELQVFTRSHFSTIYHFEKKACFGSLSKNKSA